MRLAHLLLALVLLLISTPSISAEPVKITLGVEPALSYDASLLAFASTAGGQRDLYLIQANGRELRLTEDIYWDGHPAFTPTARSIVFISDRTGARELWLIRLKDKTLIQLTSDGLWKSSPSVSLDGAVVYTAGRHPKLDLYLYEDGAVRRLTNLEAEVYSPVWSPDGRRIAFVKGDELMVINRDGSEVKEIAKGVYHRGLSWTEDGRILFLARKKGYDLYGVDAEGRGRPEQVYAGVSDSWEVEPSVSGKGDIAFSTDKDGAYTIYLLKSDWQAEAQVEELDHQPPPINEPAPHPEPVEAASPAPEDSPQLLEKPLEDETGAESRHASREGREDLLKPALDDWERSANAGMKLAKPSAEKALPREDVELWLLAAFALLALVIEKKRRPLLRL